MKDIRLQSLTLKNFKGIEEYTLDLNGKNANIYAMNAKGKTSLYDAFLWLLFSKDSQNKTDYMIKPQDEFGNEFHHLESVVEGVLLVDGKPLKLKRQLSEKWTKNQKTKTVDFSGNETSYWVNDVPTKAKDYAIEIGSIIKENIFKLLTNPLFFNTNEKGFGWQERRKILFEISGNVSDSDVIDSAVTMGDKSMLDLLNVINSGRTIDNHKLVVADKIKSTMASMDGIPSRINEQQRNITVDAVDYTAIETSLAEQKAILEGIEVELATNAQGASLYRQKQQQAYKLQGEIDARKKELDVESGAGLKVLIDSRTFLEGEKYRIHSLMLQLTNRHSLKTEELRVTNTRIAGLREKWNAESATQLVQPEGLFCPTCEQALPEDKAQEKLGKLKENFEKNKAENLASIQLEGKANADKRNLIIAELSEITTDTNTQDTKYKQVIDRLAELETEIGEQQQPTVNYAADDIYSVLQVTLKRVSEELDKPIEDTTTKLLAQKREVNEQIESLNKTLNQKEVVAKAKTRIFELKAEESKLATELNGWERQDFLIKQFTTAKVKILEDAINNRFTTVKFKMFDTLNDGTEKEICRTLVNTNGVWVEFDGANNGGKINAGIDIINLLSEFYGVSLPLFIDNAESLSSFTEIKTQVIKLIVSEQDERLRVEVKE